MKTKTEAFAVDCAAAVFSTEVSEVEAQVEAGAGSWVAIVELIMSVVIEIIENCPERNKLASILASGPSRWQRLQLRRTTLNIADCCGYQMYRRESGEIADTIISLGSSKTAEEINTVIEEVTNPDNWLF